MRVSARWLVWMSGLALIAACGPERFDASAVTLGGGGGGPGPSAGSGGDGSGGDGDGTGGDGSDATGGSDGSGGSDGTGGDVGAGSGGSITVTVTGTGSGGDLASPDARVDVTPGTGGATVDASRDARDARDAARPDPCAPVRADGGAGGGCDCESYRGHAYLFCRTGRSFTDAEADCVAHGMRLIRLDSAAENTWAYATKKAKEMMTTWIGATDAVTEGDWRWVDNTPFWNGRGATAGGKSVGGLYQDWDVKAAEPNQNGNEDCAGYWYQIPTWADLTCTDLNAYVCEAY
ncbi:MAG TPA: lectin-like protein [Polyangia bacterium]|nr:lectin-like protein [Polyangia bacterium]